MRLSAAANYVAFCLSLGGFALSETILDYKAIGVGQVTQPQWLLEGGRHGRQAARGESLGAVHVWLWAKDEDCDEKRSATRSRNGSAFSIYSWPQSPRGEGSKQIQTSSPYSGYLPRASRRDGSRMPSIAKRFSQSKKTSLVRK